jgi:GNAT superfamily N-acetyltransferase
MEAIIKEATIADLALIKEMAHDIWPQYYSNIISMEQINFMLDKLYNVDALAEAKRNGERFFIISIAANPIGYFSIMPLEPGKSKFKLPKLYLYPKYRGKGLGAKMLLFAEAEAKKMGASELTLNVNRYNPSYEFYKKRGYRVEETVDIPFGQYFLNDYVMSKKLVDAM